MFRKSLIPGILALLIIVSGAHANVSYQYEGIVQGPVTANSSVTVNLYLQETVTGASSSLIASEGGLYSGAVTAFLSSGSGATITAAANNTQTEPQGFTGNNNHFVYNNIGPVGGVGSAASIADITANSATIPPGPSGTTNGGSVTSAGGVTTTLVWLGSLTIDVGATADATFSLVAFKNGPSGTFDAGSFGDTLSATNIIDLDHTNDSGFQFTGAADLPAGTFTIATTAGVPEPSSIALCGFAAFGMGLGAWRRYRAGRTTAPEQFVGA